MPPFPLSLQYLWVAYHRIRRRKGGNGFSVSPIEWGDIDAFIRLTHVDLVPWEINLIERLDDAFVAAPSEVAAKTDGDDFQEEA
jgi:hypothetical protein